MIRWPGWQRRQTCDGRKWNWISGCSTPARLRMNPPAFTSSHQVSLQKCEKGFKIIISLRKWGRVSDQRSKNRPTNKQELAPRICEKRTHALRTSLLQIFGFTKKKITSRCAVAAAPVLFKNHSTPTWGKHLRVALPLSSVYLSIIYQLNILFNF